MGVWEGGGEERCMRLALSLRLLRILHFIRIQGSSVGSIQPSDRRCDWFLCPHAIQNFWSDLCSASERALPLGGTNT